MDTDYTYSTIRIWKETLKKLRLLAALKDKRMVAVLDDIISQELEQEQTKKQNWLRTGLRKQEQ